MKPTLSATLPDGKTATRTTARAYTHVVCVLSLSCQDIEAGITEPTWGALTWTTQPDKALAASRAKVANWNPKYKVSGVQLVPVNSL